MSKFWTAIMQNKTKALLALSVVFAGLIPATLLAWGPSRPTFTEDKVAQYIVFNSKIDNPLTMDGTKIGDERNFVRIKQEGGSYVDKISVTPGKEYTVFVYFHNDAATRLNLVATNTMVSSQIPSVLKAGESGTISAKVSADNATPRTVWDEAYITTTSDVAVRYVPGSAVISSFGAVNGQKIDADKMFSTGALVGYNALDGKIPGCREYSGYITYKIKIDQPNFSIKKEVSLMTEKRTWVDDQIEAAPGKEVEYRIIYKNTGTTDQRDVIIKDVLPAYTTYVKGSSLLANTNSGWNYSAISDNAVTSSGINIGHYSPGAEAYVKLRAKINSDLACGKTYTLTNTALAITKNGTKQDAAKVIVKTPACVAEPVKITVCELSTKKIVTILESEFNTTKYSKNLDDCKEVPVPVKITVCELSTKKIVTILESEFNTTKYSKNLDDCKEVPEPVKITVCELSTKKIVTILESEFNTTKYSKNLDDCKEVPVPVKITVCELSTKKIVTILESEFNTTKYSKNLDDCKEVPVPVKITVCELSTKKIVTILESEFNTTKYSKNLDDCKEVPVPEELPKTGINGLENVIGLGMLVASTAYYATSKRY